MTNKNNCSGPLQRVDPCPGGHDDQQRRRPDPGQRRGQVQGHRRLPAGLQRGRW